MAMYRIDVHGEVDFYYQYELDDEVVESFESLVLKDILKGKGK